MSAAALPPAGADVHYLAVGHVTVDVLADGSRRPGGSALYSALQASRLGARARILTRGDPDEITRMLAPFAGEVEVEVEPAAQTTTLATAGSGSLRRQRMLAWAGPISPRALAGSVVHLAPVAAELAAGWEHLDGFVGLTPQGLVRRWNGPEAEVELGPCPAAGAEFGTRADALVVSTIEQTCCGPIIASALAHEACVAITAGTSPTRLLHGSAEINVAVAAGRAAAIDDLGAGDVFAAALFLALARGEPLLDAAQLAHAAAGARVRGVGAQAVGELAAVEAELRR